MPIVTKLYAFGSNGSGQLGVGHYEDLSKPEICKFLLSNDDESDTGLKWALSENIVKIVAGGNHTLILTESGTVYASGDNGGGRCDPLELFKTSYQFRQVKTADRLGRITDIAATWDASFIVVEDSKVYTFGTGEQRMLTNTKSVSDIEQDQTPMFEVEKHASTEKPCRILAITASMQHVVLVLSDGVVFGWGGCRKGQLGVVPDGTGSTAIIPIRIEVSSKVAQAVTGRDYTFLRSTQGDCVLLGEKKHFVQPFDFKQHLDSSLQSGWSSVFNIENGILFGIGKGKRGQLPPDKLPILKAFAAGSEHVIALSADGSILAWGWGEHGNCGQPLDDRGNVAGRYNTIETKLDTQEIVAGLGAGCATSFFWTQTESRDSNRTIL